MQVSQVDSSQNGVSVASSEQRPLPSANNDKNKDQVIALFLDRGANVGVPFPEKSEPNGKAGGLSADRAKSIAGLASAARRQGLDRSEDLLDAVAAFTDMLLAEKLMQNLADTVIIDEQEVRARFDQHPERYDEFSLSHIFVPFGGAPIAGQANRKLGSEAEALNVAMAAEAKLKAGADFGSLAQSISADTATATEGGMLPSILGANIQPAFLAAVEGLKDGERSGVVKGDEGYHIILLNRRSHFYSGPARDMISREIKAREMARLLKPLQSLPSNGR
jgi:hypothetical protein